MHAEIKITTGGQLVFIYDDELQPLLALGEPHVARASDVEPIPTGERAGQWCVNLRAFCNRFGLRPAKLLGPFSTRHAALFAEKGYIEQVLFGADQ